MTFSLADLLERSARRDPDEVALAGRDGTLTYGELDRRAGAVASFLLAEGVARQDRVGVYLDRGFDAMAAIFGILRAGAAYVPLDPSAPPERAAEVLRDGGVRLLLGHPARAAAIARVLAHGVAVEVLGGVEPGSVPGVRAVAWDDVYAAPAKRRPVAVIEQDLAVLYYTSGTTGKPKGVVHSHRSMLANVEWALATFGLRAEDRVSGVTPHHFDLSWLELFATVAAGATLVQVPESTLRFPDSLAALAAAERMTVWCSVPSVLVGLVERADLDRHDLSALRWVLFAGERFPTPHLVRLMRTIPGPAYCNMYGTTETHIAAYFHVAELPEGSDRPLPIGRACEHVNLLVVGEDGRPVPPGSVGELVIRGPSVMEGYWELPDRTAAALAPVAFTPLGPTRCYHTGDLVAVREDGNIEIAGRGDRRVKVRGHLLDLDEVEAVLLAEPRVREAAAYVAAPDSSDAHVAAAVVSKAGAPVDVAELQAHAARRLPPPGVPARIALLDALPRTGSGKLDRRGVEAAVASPSAAPQGAADATANGGAAAGQEGDVVREFIVREFADPLEDKEIDDTTDLLAESILGSLAVMSLVGFLEERYGVRIPNSAIVEENFRSLPAIRRLVETLRS